MSGWDVVYERAIRDDGSLLFPKRLTHEFLAAARRTMGPYLFANQYQNKVVPEEAQKFRKEWIRYYGELPSPLAHTIFIDPAISEEDAADFTAVVVVATDCDRNWYLRRIIRERMNPTRTIELLFSLVETYLPQRVGIESVAYQQALVHFTREEMRRREKYFSVHEVKRLPTETKRMRIMRLVPKYENGKIFHKGDEKDLEDELLFFPRAAHDDIVDALASCEEIVSYPEKRKTSEKPAPNAPDYESWYIESLRTGRSVRD